MAVFGRKPDALVIRRRMPVWLRLLVYLIFGAVVLASVYYAYLYGLEQAGYVKAKADQRESELDSKLTALGTRNQELLASLARVERHLQIDKTAYTELSSSLDASTRQFSELREELSFYRSIISPSGNRSGVQIQDLIIHATVDPRRYRYKLVLIQALKHSKPVSGTVSFVIEGTTDGGEQRVTIPGPKQKALPIRFKYFQNLEGVFNLPTNFTPIRVKASIHTGRKNAPTVERWYPWPQA